MSKPTELGFGITKKDDTKLTLKPVPPIVTVETLCEELRKHVIRKLKCAMSSDDVLDLERELLTLIESLELQHDLDMKEKVSA